jgi:hypothetical protein
VGPTLYVAAGGGGDAVAAWMLHAGHSADRPVIATFAWDRLMIDPLPGPRAPQDFAELVVLDGLNAAFGSASRPIPPAGSTLPRLAGEIDATLVLLDPTHGAQGLHAQLQSLAQTTSAGRVEVVDVGGDILAHGDEPELLSPLADSLVLAATDDLGLPVRLHVLGAGLDGELPTELVAKHVESLGGRAVGTLARDAAERVLPVLEWHPSESTALVVAAAHGHRGTVEVRDRGRVVLLDDRSSTIFEVDHDAALEHSLTASAVRASRTLDEAEDLVRAVCGSSELDYERAKAARRQPGPPVDFGAQVDAALDYLRTAGWRGVDYVTYRRLAEVTGCGYRDSAELRRAVIARVSRNHVPPLIRTSPATT